MVPTRPSPGPEAEPGTGGSPEQLFAALSDVVAFYNLRFQMGLTGQEQAGLVAFLRSL